MYLAAVFLPLIGAILTGMLAFAGGPDKERNAGIDRAAGWITSGAMLLAAVAAIFAFFEVVVGGRTQPVEVFTWLDSGSL